MNENSARIVVSDTGALISLEKITGGYDFIRKLYDVILVPPAVMEDLAENYDSPGHYLRYYRISDLITVKSTELITIEKKLDKGEIEAISLAFNLKLPLLIEEAAGRGVAHFLGLSFSGIARQVVNAYKKRTISADDACDKLNELMHTNRINPKVFDALRSKIW
ncbi:MAG: hypothetical protein HQK59_06450 [Deltaproteobacteria bacterium]|nr:hypothetical protein [Deltaproteobacteria bacterium]